MKSKIYGALTMLAATLVLALPMLNAQSRPGCKCAVWLLRG